VQNDDRKKKTTTVKEEITQFKKKRNYFTREARQSALCRSKPEENGPGRRGGAVDSVILRNPGGCGSNRGNLSDDRKKGGDREGLEGETREKEYAIYRKRGTIRGVEAKT